MQRLQTLQRRLFYASVRSRLAGKDPSRAQNRVVATLRTARGNDTLYEYLIAPELPDIACACTYCKARVSPRKAMRVTCSCIVQIMHRECLTVFQQEYKDRCPMCMGKIQITTT